MAVNGGVEVAAGVDLIHQLTDDRGAGPALIAGIGCQDRPAVVVEGVQSHHIARLVIVDLNFWVYAQQHGPHAAVGRLRKGGGAAGALGCRSPSGSVSAGGQGGQGQSDGQGKPEPFGSNILFHIAHLKIQFVLCSLFLDYEAAV